MVSQQTYIYWLAVWVVCAGVSLWTQRRPGSGAGLTISYVLQLWILHWLAAAIYAFPWYQAADIDTVLGLQQSTYAIAGFTVGVALVLPLILGRRKEAESSGADRIGVDPRLVRSWLGIGVVTYFGAEPLLHGIPTVGAIASATSNLLLLALAIECWNGLQRKGVQRHSFWRWVILSGTLPLMTIVTKGFIGYGFASMLTVFAFVASFYRPRWKIAAWSVVIGYLALSLYVTYMRDRKDIRAVVWGGEAYTSRFTTITRTLTQFEFLDIENPDHLSRIDERLNQNFLVGRSVEYLAVNREQFAKGRTIWEAVLAPIPRAFWPNKPIAAGSGDLVSEFTGMHFAKDTSVGIGHVLEWYVNFGTPGVFFGMMGLGLLIGYIDRMAARTLYSGDATSFVVWWLPGLSLLQVGGSLVEAVGSASAGLLIALFIRKFQAGRVVRQRPEPDSPREAYALRVPARPKPTL